MKRIVLLLVFVSFCLCLPVVLSFIFLYLVLALIRSPPISFDLSSLSSLCMMGTESPVYTAIDRFVFVVVFKQVKGRES